MVEEMLMREDGRLTDWEITFLDDTYDQNESYNDGQIAKINEIYEERVG